MTTVKYIEEKDASDRVKKVYLDDVKIRRLVGDLMMEDEDYA